VLERPFDKPMAGCPTAGGPDGIAQGLPGRPGVFSSSIHLLTSSTYICENEYLHLKCGRAWAGPGSSVRSRV
jgi:hypothetical protein